jgi:ATP-dependent protease ClpP protease subunit
MALSLVENKIHLYDSIDSKVAKIFSDYFDTALSYDYPNVELHISSPGGEVKYAEDIINKIQLSYKPVDVYIHNTYLFSGVASASSVISSFARKKFIDYNATFLIHHARKQNQAGGQVEIDEKEDDTLFWMERTGLEYDIVDNLLKVETKMDAIQAFSLGFVDGIEYKDYEIPVSSIVS